MLSFFSRLLFQPESKNLNTPLLHYDYLNPTTSFPNTKKYFPFSALSTDLRHEIFYFLAPKDLVQFNVNHVTQKNIFDFFAISQFDKINSINNYRKNAYQQYRTKNRIYQFLIIIFALGTGINAFLTGRIFVNNGALVHSLQNDYHAPNYNAMNNYSCQDKLDILYQNSPVDDDDGYYEETHKSDDGSTIGKCELDTTSIRCYPICNKGLVKEEDPDCQTLHESIIKQRCYPAITAPPYLGGVALALFFIIFYEYCRIPPFNYPETFSDLMINDHIIKDFIVNIPNAGFNNYNFQDKKINAAIRAIIQYQGGLFARPENKNFRKFIDNKECEDTLTSIRINC